MEPSVQMEGHKTHCLEHWCCNWESFPDYKDMDDVDKALFLKQWLFSAGPLPDL